MALKVGELFASFNLDTSGISSAVNSAEKKLSDLGKGLAVGGAALTTAVTVPLTNAAKSIYNAGTGFDAQMSKVFAIIGEEATGSAEVMESLRQKALDMGSTTAFTASEAGEAMQYMAMAGWKTNDMLAGLSPIMDLAAASGEDLGTVSDIVTDALTAFGLTAEDTAHFTDVLAAASSNSNTNVAIMGESFKYAAPLAGSLGYSVDDVAVALGLMANAGIKGSMAGTSLRQVLSNLISPTDAQASAMEALGISLYDSNGKVKSLAELMGDMRKAASESGFDMQALTEQVAALDDQLAAGTISQESYDAQVQKLTEGNGEFLKAISDLAGARGLSGLLAIMNATDADFDKLTYAIDNSTGAAAKMKAVMLDNAQGEVTLFNSALEGLEITLWGLAEDGFRNTVRSATSLVDSFRTADEATQAGTLRFAALAAAAGPVMVGLGGIITILPKLAATFTALTGPGALLAIGMIALGAAAIDSGNSMGKTFVKGATKAGNKVRQLGKDVKKQLPTLTKNMGEFLNSISTGIEQGLPGIMEGLTNILTTGISAIAGNMGNIADVARTIVRTLADGIVNGMPDMVSSGLNLLTGLWSALISNIPTVRGSIARVLASLIREVNNADWTEIGTKLNASIRTALEESGTLIRQLAMGDQYTEDASWQDVGFALANSVLEGIKTSFGNYKDFIGGLLLGDQYNPDDEWGVFGEKIIDTIFESADKSIDSAASFVDGILTGISGLFTDDALDKASETLSGIAGKILDHVFAEIPHLADKAGTLLEKLGALILGGENSEGLAANVIAGATTVAGAIFTALETGFSGSDGTSAVQKLLDVLGKAFSQENMSRITTNLEGFISAIFTGMTDVLPGLADNAVEVVRGIIDLMFKTGESGTSLFGSALTSVQTLVTTLVQEIVNYIPTAASAAANLLTVLLDTLFAPQGEDGGGKSLVQGALDSIRELVGAVLRSVPGLISTMGAEAVSIITAIGTELTRKDPATDKYIASGLVDSLGSLIEQAIKDTVALIPSLGDAVTGIIGAIGDVLLNQDENGDYLITSLADSLIELVTNAVNAAVSAIPGLADTVRSIISEIAGILSEKDTDTGEYKATGLVTALMTMVTDAIHDVIGMIPGLGDSAVQIIEAIGEALFGTVDENGIRDGGAAEQLLGVIEGIVRNTLELVPDAIAGLSGFALTAFTAITDLIFGKDQEGKTVPDGLITTLTRIVQTIFDTVTNDVIPSMGDAVGGILTAIAGFFEKENLAKLGDSIGGLGESIIRGIADAIGAAVDAVVSIADGAELDTVMDGIGESLGNIAEKLVSGITYAIPKLVDAGGKLLGAFAGLFSPENLSQWVSGAADLAGSIVGSIVTALTGGVNGQGKADLTGKFAELVQGIVTGLVNAIPTAFRAGETVISAGFKLGTELVQSIADSFSGIGTGIDFGGLASSFITSLTGVLGSALTFGSEAMTAGAKIAGSLIDSLIGAFDTTIETDGVSDIGDRLRTLLQNIIAGITAVIPNLFVLGGKAISAGAVLAGDLVNSLTKGFTDESLSLNYAGIMQSLVTGLTSAVENLPKLLKDTLSAGAQIANAIMGSITTALADTANSGVGTALATAGTNLVKGLLTSVTDFTKNDAVKSFITNLGTGISASLSLLGDIAGQIVGYILSPEGLSQIWDAGVSIAQLLLGGIGSLIKGSGSFIENLLIGMFKPLTNWIETKLRDAGLLGEESIPELSVGELAIDMGYVQFDVENGEKAKQLLAATLASYTTEGLGKYFNDQAQRNLTAVVSEATNKPVDLGWFVRGIWGAIIDRGFTDDAAGIRDVFEEKFAAIGIDIGEIADEAFYEGLVGAWSVDENGRSSFDSSVFDQQYKQLFERLFNSDKSEKSAEDAAAEYAEATKKAAIEAITSKLKGTAKQSAEQEDAAFAKALQDTVFSKTEESMIDALEGASAEATAEMQGTFANEKTPVANGAAEIGDAAVRQFLLTMSAENGAAIASGFTGAMIAEIMVSGEAILNASDEAATAALSAFSDTLSANSGYSIGLNFSLGIAEGIADGVDAITQAASDAANAAVSASASTLDEHSPSRRARDEIGLMYGKGLAIGILDSMPAVMSASRKLSSSMHDQMDVSSERMGGMSIRNQPVYAGSAGRTSTVNNPTYVHNHNNNLNIDRYYQNSAEDVDYLARRIREEERRDQAGRGM